MNEELRSSTMAEAPMQASKWLNYQVLLDEAEMRQLFHFLNPFCLFYCGAVTPRGKGELSQDAFLDIYKGYLEILKSGQQPKLSQYQSQFSPIMTASRAALFAVPIDAERQLIRIAMPVIQLQAHYFVYSSLDKKFRSMVFGSDSIAWGVQFSFPQLYMDGVTKQVEQVRKIANFPNNPLFQNFQKWLRMNTTPAKFLVDGIESVVPIRMGKQCFSWIDRHSQLNQKGIKVIR